MRWRWCWIAERNRDSGKAKGPAIARWPSYFLAPRPGLEPGTYGLTVRYGDSQNQRVSYLRRSAILAHLVTDFPGRLPAFRNDDGGS